MLIKHYSRKILLFASLAAISHLAYNYFRRKEKKSINKMRKEIHEAILFSHNTGELKRSKYSRCRITHSMERLLHYLNSPRHSLDICIYVITNLDIANIILKIHLRGVKVRIIIDADMAYSCGSTIKRLEKHKIPVRWRKDTNLMHHKFCLIDASCDDPSVTAVVMTGSLNWTNQALYGNWENVLVTSTEQLVEQYKTEFERLWTMFTPVVDF